MMLFCQPQLLAPYEDTVHSGVVWRQLNRMGLSSQGLTNKNVILGKREMRAAGNTGSTPAERSLLSLEMGPEVPRWRHRSGTARGGNRTSTERRRGRRVTDRRGRGTGVAAAQSRGAAAEGLTSRLRLITGSSRQDEPCPSPGTGPGVPGATKLLPLPGRPLPRSTSIADLQTFTHPAILHSPHQEHGGPESTGRVRSRRHQRNA